MSTLATILVAWVAANLAFFLWAIYRSRMRRAWEAGLEAGLWLAELRAGDKRDEPSTIDPVHWSRQVAAARERRQ